MKQIFTCEIFASFRVFSGQNKVILGRHAAVFNHGSHGTRVEKIHDSSYPCHSCNPWFLSNPRSIPGKRAFSRGIFGELTTEPELCKIPIAQNGFGRNVQHFRDFIGFETAEELELHDVAFTRVGAGESFQCIV
jgi:hypothetical protein